MTYCVRFLAICAAVSASASSVMAAELPAIKVTSSNKVPACATPGRLMAFAQGRNGSIADKFDGVATEYMRHGEALAVRWDYAFFQMLVETANLKFVGDVNARQNNFAGLGATGGGEPGESFQDVSQGVKAHLQHVLMYTGASVDDAVAERTRKVQEWGVLTNWQKTISGPMTYTHLTRKWSPKDRGYSKDIASVANSFYSKFCEATDPRPELVAEARGTKGGVTVDETAAIQSTRDGNEAKGSAASKRAIADARETGGKRSGLGAAAIAATEPDTSAAKPAGEPAKFTMLNSSDATGDAAEQSAVPTKAPATAANEIKTASAAGAAAQGAAVMNDATAPAKVAKGACRVWQASYGGDKAVIIKVIAEGQTNYTVLDVNEGREQREVAAYIAAYAQDGSSVGEFATPTKALAKAFEMCPEG